jgi:hypothetical protein
MRKWDSCVEEDREDEKGNLVFNSDNFFGSAPGAQPDVAVILLASCTVNLK